MRSLVAALALTILLVVPATSAHAQTRLSVSTVDGVPVYGPLLYGTPYDSAFTARTRTLDGRPTEWWRFHGTALACVNVAVDSPAADAWVQLMQASPTGQPIASGSVEITRRLPADGYYYVSVTSSSGRLGGYTLLLSPC